MATTEIHAITSTPEKALDYILSDKIVLYTSDSDINKDMEYRIFESDGEKYVQYFTLTSYQDCDVLDPYSTYENLQMKWQGVRYKNNGNKAKNGKEPIMWHLHQSFEGFEVTPEMANEIGRKFAEKVFKGFTVTISTHGNTNNIHNHFIISAWGNDGKKWNDCRRTKREIRRVSDDLCEEYGLSVLEHTRDMKLVRYKDKDGKTRYYEPTDRKNKSIRRRDAGEITPDDVNSYRNTLQFEKMQEKKKNNCSEIKADIDAVLPSCRSYEELLERLRDLGYRIRDKRKNGDWLAHVSFQASSHDKSTREDKIGDGVFYLRESLTKYIKDHLLDLKQEQTQESNHGDDKPQKTVPYIAEYEYGKTALADIDNDFKTILDNSGKHHTIKRTEAERKVIADIRVKDSEVRGIVDTEQIQRIIREQGERKRQRKTYLSKTQEQRLVSQIQGGFRCLQYTEQHHIYSYKQIIDLYSANKSKYDATIENFNKAEAAISHLKEVLLIPRKLSDLLDKIESRMNDISYILEEYNADTKTVAQYKEVMAKYKIDTMKGRQDLERKVVGFETKQNANRVHMTSITTQMSELENCFRVFVRIDRENGNSNDEAAKEFELIVAREKARDKVYGAKRHIKGEKGNSDR